MAAARKTYAAPHPSPPTLTTAAHKRGYIAILMGVEGGQAIDSDLAILRTFFALGARYILKIPGGNTLRAMRAVEQAGK